MAQFHYTGELQHDGRHILICKLSRRLITKHVDPHTNSHVSVRTVHKKTIFESGFDTKIVEAMAAAVYDGIAPIKRPSAFTVNTDFNVPYKHVCIMKKDMSGYETIQQRS